MAGRAVGRSITASVIRFMIRANRIVGANPQAFQGAPEDTRKSGSGCDEKAGRQAAAKPTDVAVRRALIEGHRDLLAFLHRRLGSREEAEEVLQRFAVRAIERASDLRNVHSVRGWLSRILATTIADYQRRAIRLRRREVLISNSQVRQSRPTRRSTR
jgi:Sigma-70 region 2